MKIMAIAALAALGATAIAVQAKPAPAPASPSAAQLVAARQAAMAMSATSVNMLKGGSANGMPLKSLAFPANSLAKWAVAMPAMFANSTKGQPSRARPEVWTNKADFAAKADAMAQATKALAAAAAAEDKDAFASALASTGAACKGCHDSYQAPPPPKPAG